jgi:serine/threonine-protein kinase RsbW
MKAEFVANCSKQSLPLIRTFIERQLADLQVQEETRYQLVLAVDEACANSIIHHHHCDGTSSISVSVHRDRDTLIIELTDEGIPYPIQEYQPKSVDEIIRNRTKGGLGIQLINKIMDKIEIVQHKQEFTYRFIKYL